jgi:hypothetical protein
VIRFAWLRFRTQAAVAFGLLVIAAVVLAVTGPGLAHAYDTTVATCKPRGDCAAALSAFPPSGDRALNTLARYLLFGVPGLIGVFWGAPLVAREFETGTFRLSWTQGITRARWLAVKIGVVGGAGMVTAGLLSLILAWWSSPIEKVTMDRLTPAAFGAGGIAPIGYTAFAFALGVTAGMLIRRTLPAMAVTLVIFTAVQVAVPLWVRPHLIAPVQTTSALNVASITEVGSGAPGGAHNGSLFVQAQPDIPGAWILSSQVITPAGRPAASDPATGACAGPSSTRQSCNAYLETLHLRQEVTYQPLSRYWVLQWYESAIFLALALILAGFCSWWIRRSSEGLGIGLRTSQRAPALERSA